MKNTLKEGDLLCKVLTPFTTLGWGMLHVCKMRVWERLAESISGVAGLMPKKKKKGTKEDEKKKKKGEE